MKDINRQMKAMFKPRKVLGTSKNRIMKMELKGSLPFKDTDRDGHIDFVDCKPYNPKKAGLLDFVSYKVRGVAEKRVPGYKEYKEGEPERLKQKAEVLEAKKRVTVAERQLADEKRKRAEARRATVGAVGAGVISGFPAGGASMGFYESPKKKKGKKKGKKK